MSQNGLDVPDEIVEVDTLSRYASEARYPGIEEPVTEEEYQEAVKMAEAVVIWAASQAAQGECDNLP